MTSSITLDSREGGNGEPGTPRGRPRLGLAPRTLTPSPVTGWQEVGKPTSTYFNTTSHVTDWFPHAAVQERVTAILSAHRPPGHARQRPALDSSSGSPPSNSGDGSRPQGLTRQGWGHVKGAKSPHSLLPMFLGQATGHQAWGTRPKRATRLCSGPPVAMKGEHGFSEDQPRASWESACLERESAPEASLLTSRGRRG